MPRPKKLAKRESTLPQTLNEHLAAGVDFEEAGEKWRAGDSQKAARFFTRAWEAYDTGLQKFRDSKDLAYNKARLQYDLSQQAQLLVHLPYSSVELLRLALSSHRYALELDPENADLLFNTAQLLTSLAESTSEGISSSNNGALSSLQLFQEALELFQNCLSIQEFQLTQSQEQIDDGSQVPMNESNGDFNSVSEPWGKDPGTSDGDEDETWATIVEPITEDTLLDTAIAQLETLTSICNLLVAEGSGDPGWIEQYQREILQERISLYLQSSHRHHEIELVQARLSCSLADARFHTGHLDLQAYEQALTTVYGGNLNLGGSFKGLCDQADAEIKFNEAAQAAVRRTQHLRMDEVNRLNVLRWKHLSKALDSLTAAAKIEGASQLWRVHLRRGDCEMFRLRLSDPPTKYDLAYKSRETLLKNAEIYYGGAARFANQGGAREEEREASVKEAATASILGRSEKMAAIVGSAGFESVQEIIDDMLEDDLLSRETVALLSNNTL